MLFYFHLVYDTSNRESFNKLEEWLNEVEVYSTKRDIIKMLVGNKIDKVRSYFKVDLVTKYAVIRSL